MRLIDADAVAEAIKDEITEAKGIDADPNFTAGLKLGLAYINTAESVDAVPVVRCWECVHYYEDDGLAVCNDPGNLNGLVYENDYCSRGEREVFDETD